MANIDEAAKKLTTNDDSAPIKNHRLQAIKNAVDKNQLTVREANEMIMAKAKQVNTEML